MIFFCLIYTIILYRYIRMYIYVSGVTSQNRHNWGLQIKLHYVGEESRNYLRKCRRGGIWFKNLAL